MKFLILFASLFFSVSTFAKSLPELKPVILDVRTADEFNEEHAREAVNVDVSEDSFEKRMQTMDKSRKYVVYCKAGGRAEKAVTKMKAMGFKNVENIATVDEAVKKYGADKAAAKTK